MSLLLADLCFTAAVSAASVMGTLYLVSMSIGIGGGEYEPESRTEAVVATIWNVVSLQPHETNAGLIPTIVDAHLPSDLQFTPEDVDAWHDRWEVERDAGLVPPWAVWPNIFSAPDDVFDRGQVRVFTGTYQDFLEQIGW